jgi:hypothetical protein
VLFHESHVVEAPGIFFHFGQVDGVLDVGTAFTEIDG